MKHILAFFLLTFLVVYIQAQTIIDNNDMPQEGDTIRQSNTFDTGTINYLETGEGINWDFSSLIPLTQKVDTFVSFSSTPWVYQLIFFGSANLAQPLLQFDQLPGFQVTDSYNFYKNTSSSFVQAGNAATLNEIPLPNKFSDPDKIFQFPLNFGNADSSYSTYNFAVPGIGYLGGWKNRVNHADGWGTLTTPYGTFNVLRVKSEVMQYDSIYIDSLGFGIPTTREYTEYKWLGENFGLPLCTVTDDGLLSTITYIDSVRNILSGVSEIDIAKKIRIFPNPCEDKISIQSVFPIEMNHGIEVLNMEGKVVQSFKFQNASNTKKSLHLNFNQGAQSGIYFLKFVVEGRVVLMKIVRR